MESINSYSSTLFTEAAEVLRVVKHLSPEDALTEFLSSVKSIGWDETQRKITDMKKEKYLALHQK